MPSTAPADCNLRMSACTTSRRQCRVTAGAKRYEAEETGTARGDAPAMVRRDRRPARASGCHPRTLFSQDRDGVGADASTQPQCPAKRDDDYARAAESPGTAP